MVDVNALNVLPETVEYPAEIPRLEDGWWPTGGAVDPENDSGLMNWQAQLLANRTAWLKEALAGMGGNAVVVTDLDTIDRTCVFLAEGSAVGVPYTDRDYRGIHIASRNGTEHSQIVFGLNNYLAFRDADEPGEGWGAWREILHDASGKVRSYYSTDAPDSWIIGENIKGDTAVVLDTLSGRCHRLGALAHISLSLNVSGFSVPANDDAAVTLSLDINALAATAGWFTSIASDAIDFASLEFLGVGWDAPSITMDVTAQSATGTIYFSSQDTGSVPAQVSNATSLRLRVSFTVLVED